MLCLALCDLLYVLLRSTNMSEAILFFIIIIIFLSLFIQGSTTFHVLKTFPPSFTFTFFWKIVIFHLNLEINIPLNPFFSIFLFGLPSIFENMNKTSLYNNLVSVINQFDDHWKKNWDTFSLIDQLISSDELITLEMRWCSYTTL